MCGIFGLVAKPNSTYKQDSVRKILENIAKWVIVSFKIFE
jgi:hypothetical protein